MASCGKCQVFVSHAGEDKKTIAFPLREMLHEKGINTFVDEKDIAPGGAAIHEMTTAMNEADVAVIVLSPEFVAKKWPMRELLFFRDRREEALANGESVPVLIPVFYRLSVKELYEEPKLERELADGTKMYESTRFYERREKREPEADIATIKRALQTVRGIQGVENKYGASNEESCEPSRQLLLNKVYKAVSEAVEEQVRRKVENNGEGEGFGACGASGVSSLSDGFCRYFHAEPLCEAILDFDSVDSCGKPVTLEGQIKHQILNCKTGSKHVVAIRGGGGVGKSTILKALANDEDVRRQFCGGVHFISLGTDATRQTLLRRICKIMRDSGGTKMEERLRSENDLDSTISEAMRWFGRRRCAFLIDDIWTKNIGMDVFARVCKLGNADEGSAVVLTTREHEIASVAALEGSFHVTPREALGKKSREMLFFHACMSEKYTMDEEASGAIKEVLQICGGLPVSLAAAGKGVKMFAMDRRGYGEVVWNEYAQGLRNYREKLLRENVDDYGNVYVTFGASLASLASLEERKEERLGFMPPMSFAEMHRRLCTLPKQAIMNSRTLKRLWDLEADDQAKAVGMQFVQVGLAESRYELALCRKRSRLPSESVYDVCTQWYLGIHDSLHDFALSEARLHGNFVHVLESMLCPQEDRDFSILHSQAEL